MFHFAWLHLYCGFHFLFATLFNLLDLLICTNSLLAFLEHTKSLNTEYFNGLIAKFNIGRTGFAILGLMSCPSLACRTT